MPFGLDPVHCTQEQTPAHPHNCTHKNASTHKHRLKLSDEVGERVGIATLLIPDRMRQSDAIAPLVPARKRESLVPVLTAASMAHTVFFVKVDAGYSSLQIHSM
jgi:hypothetical protein